MLSDIIYKFIPILIAIIMHEVAHGYAAYWLGDETAKRSGRLSLNPVKHADPFGTFLLPVMLWIANAGFMFGWAKPVPIDFQNLKYGRWGMLIVSAAGIIMNIWLALVSALVLMLVQLIPSPQVQMVISMFFLNLLVFNIILAVFNALPIPPLDGSKILFGWINKPWAVKYVNSDRIGLAAIVILIFVLPEIGNALGVDLNLFRSYMIKTTRFLSSILL